MALANVILSAVLSATAICAAADDAAVPEQRVIPFSELGMGFPLSLTLPGDYVVVKRFRPIGVIVLCAQEDESQLKDNGDFSGAKRAVISIRPSSSAYYDEKRKVFSFEGEMSPQLKAAGASNYRVTKRDVRGVPVAATTFEVGERKIYAMDFAAGPVLVHLAYNARSKSREIDDRIWAALVDGL